MTVLITRLAEQSVGSTTDELDRDGDVVCGDTGAVVVAASWVDTDDDGGVVVEVDTHEQADESCCGSLSQFETYSGRPVVAVFTEVV